MSSVAVIGHHLTRHQSGDVRFHMKLNKWVNFEKHVEHERFEDIPVGSDSLVVLNGQDPLFSLRMNGKADNGLNIGYYGFTNHKDGGRTFSFGLYTNKQGVSVENHQGVSESDKIPINEGGIQIVSGKNVPIFSLLVDSIENS